MRLNGSLELVLSTSVSIIGIEMMHLQPFFVAAADVFSRSVRGQAEGVERLGF